MPTYIRLPWNPQYVGIYEGDLPPSIYDFPFQYTGQDPNFVDPASLHIPSPIANKGDVVREKEFLNRYALSTNSAVLRDSSKIPQQLLINWGAWYSQWIIFYNDNPIYLLPGQPGNDLDRVKKAESEFAVLQNELGKYTDVSPMLNPSNSPSAPTPNSGGLGGLTETAGKAFDFMKWGLIIGGIVLGGVLIANVRSGGDVVGKVL